MAGMNLAADAAVEGPEVTLAGRAAVVRALTGRAHEVRLLAAALAVLLCGPRGPPRPCPARPGQSRVVLPYLQ